MGKHRFMRQLAGGLAAIEADQPQRVGEQLRAEDVVFRRVLENDALLRNIERQLEAQSIDGELPPLAGLPPRSLSP